MKSNAAPAPVKSAYQLLVVLEALAADAYVTGERDLAFTLAAVSGAYSQGLDRDIANLIESVIGSHAKTGILLRLADEAARSNAAHN